VADRTVDSLMVIKEILSSSERRGRDRRAEGIELAKIQVGREEAEKQRKHEIFKEKMQRLYELQDMTRESAATFGAYLKTEKALEGKSGNIKTDANKIIGAGKNKAAQDITYAGNKLNIDQRLMEVEEGLTQYVDVAADWQKGKDVYAGQYFDIVRKNNRSDAGIVGDFRVDSQEIKDVKSQFKKDHGREITEAELAGVMQGFEALSTRVTDDKLKEWQLGLQRLQLQWKKGQAKRKAMSDYLDRWRKETISAYSQLSNTFDQVFGAFEDEFEDGFERYNFPTVLKTDEDFEQAMYGISSFFADWVANSIDDDWFTDINPKSAELAEEFVRAREEGSLQESEIAAVNLLRNMTEDDWAKLDEDSLKKEQMQRLQRGFMILDAYQQSKMHNELQQVSADLLGIKYDKAKEGAKAGKADIRASGKKGSKAAEDTKKAASAWWNLRQANKGMTSNTADKVGHMLETRDKMKTYKDAYDVANKFLNIYKYQGVFGAKDKISEIFEGAIDTNPSGSGPYGKTRLKIDFDKIQDNVWNDLFGGE